MKIHHPTTIDEALATMSSKSQLLAGGTDMMVEVKFGHRHPEEVVALRRIQELKTWEGNRIGSGVTWREIERKGPKGLAEAARTVGSPQIRNAGTIGGNVATASPAGDGLPFLAAVDASIELRSSRGGRTLPWGEFFLDVKRTAMEPDEIITSIDLPDTLPARQAFAKVGVRNAMVIATVCCVVTRDSDASTRVALGSVAPTTMRAKRAEEMISSIARPSESDLDEFARLVSAEVRPITDHRSTGAYRRHAAGVVARRLLERCLR
jgi:CO/xanthine dehydrogenase FAD-binding subunit